jgi:uncharacterized protein
MKNFGLSIERMASIQEISERLKDFRDRNETGLPAIAAQMLHRCNRCGVCCLDQRDISIDSEDLKKISGYLKISRKQFVASYTRIDSKAVGRSLKTKEGCPFYDEEKRSCAIYPVRPKVCRVFPMMSIDDTLSDKGIAYHFYDTCEGAEELAVTLLCNIQSHNMEGRRQYLEAHPEQRLILETVIFLKGIEMAYPESEISKKRAQSLGITLPDSDSADFQGALLEYLSCQTDPAQLDEFLQARELRGKAEPR